MAVVVVGIIALAAPDCSQSAGNEKSEHFQRASASLTAARLVDNYKARFT
jgi:hypothetical protein